MTTLELNVKAKRKQEEIFPPDPVALKWQWMVQKELLKTKTLMETVVFNEEYLTKAMIEDTW